MASGLSKLGVEVVVVEDKVEPHTPDSVFPNNWFSTHPDGTLCLYPMEALARRNERDPDTIAAIEKMSGSNRTLDLTYSEKQGLFLEGTGSLILDHDNRVAYASISSRTDPGVLDTWAHLMKYEVVSFTSCDREGVPIYHTNVMMCLGDKFVVICLESVPDGDERELVAAKLRESGREIVEISFDQVEQFAGNMLLIESREGKKILAMSQRARNSLNRAQVETLEKYSSLAAFYIETIEDCGGGSVRCMIVSI